MIRIRRLIALATPAFAVLFATAACSLHSGPPKAEGYRPPTPAEVRSSGSAVPRSRDTATESSATLVPRIPSATPAGVPAPQQIDRHDATATSKSAVIVMYAADTDIDRSPYDSMLRTLPYLDETLAADFREANQQSGGMGEWLEWSTHHVVTTVVAEPAIEMGQPADTPFDAYRKWAVTVTPRGRDGWQGEPYTTVVYTTLSRDGVDAAWQVSGIVAD
ncbi:hypothetical protein GCM10023205_71160 [Yinghuangia aomiensis]|uniref:Uncharacterized protein n=1 Tax=Yinghuangia aomiensis TaxID=676205 RepID=A0ABP9I6S0_9ACTN